MTGHERHDRHEGDLLVGEPVSPAGPRGCQAADQVVPRVEAPVGDHRLQRDDELVDHARHPLDVVALHQARFQEEPDVVGPRGDAASHVEGQRHPCAEDPERQRLREIGHGVVDGTGLKQVVGDALHRRSELRQPGERAVDQPAQPRVLGVVGEHQRRPAQPHDPRARLHPLLHLRRDQARAERAVAQHLADVRVAGEHPHPQRAVHRIGVTQPVVERVRIAAEPGVEGVEPDARRGHRKNPSR